MAVTPDKVDDDESMREEGRRGNAHLVFFARPTIVVSIVGRR